MTSPQRPTEKRRIARGFVVRVTYCADTRLAAPDTSNTLDVLSMASFVMHEARSTCDSSVNRMKTPCIRVQMSLLTRKSPPMIRSALLVR